MNRIELVDRRIFFEWEAENFYLKIHYYQADKDLLPIPPKKNL